MNRKLVAALAADLTPIVCIGETLEEREANETLAGARSADQGGLDGLTGDQVASLVIAYEPVWAIGTGRNATPQQAGEAHAHIRAGCGNGSAAMPADQCHVIYGGSVKPDNIHELDAAAGRGRRAGRRRQPGRPGVLRNCFSKPPNGGIIGRYAVLPDRVTSTYSRACLLLLVVLLQQGKGGDMASAFGGGGSQTAFGARAGATVLTKATTVLGVLFMLGAIVLGISARRAPVR